MQLRTWVAAGLVAVLAACGGGGGGSTSGGNTPPPATGSDHVALAAWGPTGAVGSGSTVQFDIVITNPGSVAGTNVAGTFSAGAGLTLGSVTCTASGGATCPAAPETLSVASLPAAGSLHFKIAAVLAPGTRGPVVSNASVTADNETASTNNSAQIAFNAFTADILVTGTGPTSALASGDTATYAMTVSNAGPDDASGVDVQNVVDVHQRLTAITCTSTGGATCPATFGPNMTIATLPKGGSVTFQVSALVSASAIGSVSDTLYVNLLGDPTTSNNVATVTASTSIGAANGGTSFVHLQSDAGDYIGQGRSYSYDQTNAVITVTATGGHLTVNVKGNEQWNSDYLEPNALALLQPGAYANLPRYPFGAPGAGGLSLFGEGRGCNMSLSRFTIASATYVNGTLTAVDLSFEQHCEGAVAALRGQIRWFANDTSQPAGPVDPPPANLWRAAPAATPASGNYIYLKSDAGDFIGGGQTSTYTQANSTLTLVANGGHLGINVAGNGTASGDFQTMDNVSQLLPGYYAGLHRFPFYNPAVGGLNWDGNGRGCNTLSGWFVIDSITFANGSLASVDLRFEQHCEGASPALHGQIHWAVGDLTQPPGPQNPPPAGLWTPPPGATPATGNYIYLSSDTTDYVGQGLNYLYTPATDTVSVIALAAHVVVNVNGQGGWQGNFVGMNSISQMLPGYYPGLQRWPFNNPATGGIDWSGFGRGCNTETGWFVIDSITFTNGSLASIDLRFEQHCEGLVPALHGKIHWIN